MYTKKFIDVQLIGATEMTQSAKAGRKKKKNLFSIVHIGVYTTNHNQTIFTIETILFKLFYNHKFLF